MCIARAECGVRAGPPGHCNPRITAYHEGTNIQGYDDKVSWCSSFVHWMLARAQIGEHVHLLGGHQLDEVREHSYPAPNVLAYRWPAGMPPA